MTDNANRPLGITIVAILMILFGLAEAATGFTHNFLACFSSWMAPSTLSPPTLFSVDGPLGGK